MNCKRLLFGLLLPVVLACGCSDVTRVNGGTVDVAFSSADQSNVDTNPVPATDLAVIAREPMTGGVTIGVLALVPVGEYQNNAWQLVLDLGSEPTEGKVYDLSAGDATLFYQQNPGEGYRAWTATAGSITVDSRSGATATFVFGPASMAVDPKGTGNDATGTFQLSGSVTVDDLDNIVQF